MYGPVAEDRRTSQTDIYSPECEDRQTSHPETFTYPICEVPQPHTQRNENEKAFVCEV